MASKNRAIWWIAIYSVISVLFKKWWISVIVSVSFIDKFGIDKDFATIMIAIAVTFLDAYFGISEKMTNAVVVVFGSLMIFVVMKCSEGSSRIKQVLNRADENQQ